MIRFLTAIALPIATLAGCVTPDGSPAGRTAQGTLRDASGVIKGTAALVRTGETLSLAVAVQGLPPGERGIHLHTTGRCDAPDFATAGGHLNPAQHQHGTLNPAGHHLGDLPNIRISASGVGPLTVPLAGSASAIEASLFDADGTAVVIHAGPDDYRTDPSGNSGGRIACAVLRKV
jgi:Cu-Zn family superoxide dismutase